MTTLEGQVQGKGEKRGKWEKTTSQCLWGFEVHLCEDFI